MKIINHIVIKTAIGVFLAINIANFFSLKYGITTALVTIISIQSTKKESFLIAMERFIASIIGLFISALFFKYLGFTPLAFSLFVLIFMPICIKLKIIQGFLATTVLSTHLLAEKSIAFPFLLNELQILVFGALIAILLNLYMPKEKDEINNVLIKINEHMKAIINYMADDLISGSVNIEEDKVFKNLKKELNYGKELAFKEFNNELLSSSTYHMDLFSLKRNHYKTLVRMRKYFYRFYLSSEHTYIVSNFTKRVAQSIGQNKIYEEVLIELEDLKKQFREMPLPATREEFENRATLYHFFSDIEDFLELKQEFMKKHPKI